MSRVLPILFNTEMVQAILEGRKTVTRRLLKLNENTCGLSILRREDDSIFGIYEIDESRVIGKKMHKPPCNPGDILYVRETWHKYKKRVGKGNSCRIEEFYGYKASIANSEDADEKWRPSIHMPKEAARIWLKVTDVRVERLQEISGQEVLKEGINSLVHPNAFYFDMNQRDMFARLWNSTIKKSDFDFYGWDANPLVWAIEFERCEKPQEV